MAVKASATITLSSVVDVKSVWRYYKLQASTLSKPSKPTTNPPSGWTTTEPSYTSGSTNSLYFCDLTVFCDGTFSYSDVSLSSSYEAAKAAYNKAVAAKDAADNAQNTADRKGIDYSQGKMLYTDPSFAEGVNSAKKYDNGSAGSVALTRTAKSSDNPMAGTSYELTISNAGTSTPGCGGFYFGNASRTNAVFIYRIIAKIPAGRQIGWATNSVGTDKKEQWLTPRDGTGKFTEYVFKLVCGSTGTFSSTGYFYINGTVGTSASPVKWYVAYATCFDMTNISDVSDLENKVEETYTTKVEFSESESEIRMDFTKSIQTASGELQSKIDSTNSSMNEQFTEINKYIRFVDGKIVLGETGNELMLTIQNDRVSFTQAGVEVAYFSNNNLYIKRAEVLTTLRVGNYEFAPRNDGGLALKKRSV